MEDRQAFSSANKSQFSNVQNWFKEDDLELENSDTPSDDVDDGEEKVDDFSLDSDESPSPQAKP